MCTNFVFSIPFSSSPVNPCPMRYFTKKALQLSKAFVYLLTIKWRRIEDLNFCIQVKGWRISNTQSHEEEYWMCAINVLCFLDYWFYKLVEYGFRKGQVSYLININLWVLIYSPAIIFIKYIPLGWLTAFQFILW